MEERNKERLSKAFGLFLILLIIANFIPTSYNLMEPGLVKNLSEVIEVEDGYETTTGSFYLTAVASPPASILDFIYVKIFNPRDKELVPRDEQIPEDMDMFEYLEIMSDSMEISKLNAKALAFEKVGLDYTLRGEGAEILEVMEDGTAYDLLKKGDIIIKVDDQQVEFMDQVATFVQQREIGDMVEITVLRNEEEKAFNLETIERENNPGKPAIGIQVVNRDLFYEFEREVKFNTEQIVGPSAGGMFVLEIYNQLIEGDITQGQHIAGTGSITADGKINRIDGAFQKVIGAEDRNIDFFLVPEDNYEDALAGAETIEVIAINTVDEAFEFLEQL